MLTFEIENEAEVRAAWAEALGKISDGIGRGVRLGVEEGAAEARRVHRYKDRTGKLTASTRGRMETVTRGGAVGILQATRRYASYVEGGTRPHVIVPKKKRALRWVDEAGVHFAKRVHHPGTQPFPFMGPALLKAERVILREVEIGVVEAQRVMDR